MSKKHLNEIETLGDLLTFLCELCATSDGGILYLPIYLKVEELCHKYKDIYKTIFTTAFIIGLAIGSIITYLIFMIFG
ncbi:MAG: hypothetical protein QXQ50_09930 [Candidatus Bathyarchaeia archaeon]